MTWRGQGEIGAMHVCLVARLNTAKSASAAPQHAKNLNLWRGSTYTAVPLTRPWTSPFAISRSAGMQALRCHLRTVGGAAVMHRGCARCLATTVLGRKSMSYNKYYMTSHGISSLWVIEIQTESHNQRNYGFWAFFMAIDWTCGLVAGWTCTLNKCNDDFAFHSRVLSLEQCVCFTFWVGFRIN